MYVGDFAPGDIVRIPWNTFDSNGASVTRAANGTVKVYKDDNTAQDTTGITDNEDFDGNTGRHLLEIDTSGVFYTAGSDYFVAVDAQTIDGQTINVWLGHFSIENRVSLADVRKWLDVAVTANANDVPDVNVADLDDAVLSADHLADDMDTYAAKVWLVDDNDGSTDRWVVAFYKNGSLMAGTDVEALSPHIRVVSAGGVELIAQSNLSRVSSTDAFVYNAVSAERISSGTAYICEVQHTDMPTAWIQPMSRDSN